MPRFGFKQAEKVLERINGLQYLSYREDQSSLSRAFTTGSIDYQQINCVSSSLLAAALMQIQGFRQATFY